ILSENSISSGTILLTVRISLIRLCSEINLTPLLLLSVKFHCLVASLVGTKILYPRKKPSNIRINAKIKEVLK
ncbi:MAG: hypothetical protein ACRDA5_06410, partial [Clostridium sp.]